MDIKLTGDQQLAFNKIMDFVKSESNAPQCLTLGGYAGTGKTTLLGVLCHQLKLDGLRLAFCTMTGKASNVLRQKISPFLDWEVDFCGTTYGLIYKCVGQNEEKQPIFMRHEERMQNLKYDLIIVDEASMVTKRIFDDLVSCGIKILAVGDHGQLGPVEGNFNLMERPDIRLETIMRQAEGSAIIKCSLMVRERGFIPHGNYYDDDGTHSVQKMTLWDGGSNILRNYFDDVKMVRGYDSIIICGRNKTRIEYNEQARGGRHDPRAGDKIICLANDYDRYVFNGSIGIIKKASALIKDCPYLSMPHYQIEADVDGQDYSREILADQMWSEKTLQEYWEEFGLWTYAYAITAHKSQGSQWTDVILIEEPVGETEDKRRRWLYTAITRSSKRLTIIQK